MVKRKAIALPICLDEDDGSCNKKAKQVEIVDDEPLSMDVTLHTHRDVVFLDQMGLEKDKWVLTNMLTHESKELPKGTWVSEVDPDSGFMCVINTTENEKGECDVVSVHDIMDKTVVLYGKDNERFVTDKTYSASITVSLDDDMSRHAECELSMKLAGTGP